MSGPLVSVVIPVFNGANYLSDAIDSALSQSYSRIEVLVVNDGSRDGGATEAMARSYGDRVRYFQKENGGVSTALNLGIREMRGDYFSWLSHDDRYLPHKVRDQVALAVSEAGKVVVYSDLEFIDPLGRVLSVKHVEPGRSLRIDLVTSDPVNGCTVLVPRECFQQVGEFNPSLRTVQDYDMWFRLAAQYRFVHLPSILVQSRLHPDQGVRTITTHGAEVEAQFARMIGALTAAEIHLVHRGSLSSFYARLAVRMKVRGFDQVARTTLELARRNVSATDPASLAQLALAEAACMVLTRKLKPSYWAGRVRARLGASARGARR